MTAKKSAKKKSAKPAKRSVAVEEPAVPRQVDLRGDPLPVQVSGTVTVRHRFKTDHFRVNVKDDVLRGLKAGTDNERVKWVVDNMRPMPTVRSLARGVVDDEAAALSDAILTERDLGVEGS